MIRILNLATLQMLYDEALEASFPSTVEIVAMEHETTVDHVLTQYDAFCANRTAAAAADDRGGNVRPAATYPIR